MSEALGELGCVRDEVAFIYAATLVFPFLGGSGVCVCVCLNECVCVNVKCVCQWFLLPLGCWPRNSGHDHSPMYRAFFCIKKNTLSINVSFLCTDCRVFASVFPYREGGMNMNQTP